MTNVKTEKTKKVWHILQNIILYLFLLICIFSVILTIVSKKDADGSADVFGYQFRVVVSDSMAKNENTDVSSYKIGSIPIRSLVVVKTMPDDPKEAEEWYRGLEIGDVLTFRYVYTTQVTITHRIVDIDEKDTGGFIIKLAGDNKNSDSGQLYQSIDTSIPNNTNYVIGEVVAKNYLLGFILSILMTPVGMVLMIIVPCMIILLLEVMKIAKMLGEEKKFKAQEKLDEKEKELDELRRRLAELESERTQAGADLTNALDVKEDNSNE